MKRVLILTVVFVSAVFSRPSQMHEEIDESKLHFHYYPTPEDGVEIVFNDTTSFLTSNLKPATETIFLLDGFTAPAFTPMTTEIKDTFSGRSDMNVIIVDYSAYTGYGRHFANPVEQILGYIYVMLNDVPKASRELADFIQLMSENNGISYDNVTIIGHSMGAHTAGVTGRAAISRHNNTIGRIIALDASVQISILDAPMMLRVGDAKVVEVYKTDRDGYGDIYHAVGDVSIFVNGGKQQPCTNADIFRGCSNHRYSWKLYKYLAHNETIKACPCRGAACLCNECQFDCGDDGISIGVHIPKDARGSYHVKTGLLEW